MSLNNLWKRIRKLEEEQPSDGPSFWDVLACSTWDEDGNLIVHPATDPAADPALLEGEDLKRWQHLEETARQAQSEPCPLEERLKHEERLAVKAELAREKRSPLRLLRGDRNGKARSDS
jgi:hypothetical protein